MSKSVRNVSGDANNLVMHRWLCIRANGQTRLTNTPPGLEADEISMELKIAVPKAIFKKPRLQAEITVPGDQIKQVVIPPKVIENITKQIHQAIGFDVVVKQ